MRGSVGKVGKNARRAMNGRVIVQRPIDASGDINPLRRGIDVIQAVDHGRRSFHEPFISTSPQALSWTINCVFIYYHIVAFW